MFSKTYLNSIVVALFLAMFGLVAVQTYLIRKAVKTEEEQFNQQINQALSNVVSKLDKERYSEDMLNYMVESVTGNDIDSSVALGQNFIERKIDIIDSIITKEGGDSVLIRIVEGTTKDPSKGIRAEARVIQEGSINDSLSRLDLIDFNVGKTKGIEDIPRDLLMERMKMISDILIRFLDPDSYGAPSKRLNLKILDSLILNELHEVGIETPYTFAVLDISGEGIEFTNQTAHNYNLLAKNALYKKRLFPGDYSQIQKSAGLTLALDLPSKMPFILKRIWWVFVLSFVIIGIIIYAFYYTISTIRKQKKLSVIKNDFISNMTHELKTPISTISLACEALNDPDFSAQQTTGENPYIHMIKDENDRLGVLVERVLQSALIEKGDLKIKEEVLDLHKIITDVAQKFKIQVDNLSGDLSLDLQASKSLLLGDRVHITNIFYNLLDNALKYRNGIPKITLHTRTKGEQIICCVADNGIGINKEYQKKIFDRLFRVPTGNVHDVKGFGLGLSYVQAIITHHDGQISVQSQPGKGSTFKLTFKLKQL